jgi:hypothetical protein
MVQVIKLKTISATPLKSGILLAGLINAVKQNKNK